MKKSLIILIVLLTYGCVSSNVTERNEYYAITPYDFTEYTAKDFVFTPEMYDGEYESRGMIEIKYMPRFVEISGNASAEMLQDYQESYVVQDPIENKYWRITRPKPDEIIRMAYEQAQEMDADAVVNFSLGADVTENGDIRVQTLTLTGFAIKRN